MIDPAVAFRSMTVEEAGDGTIVAHWTVPADLPYLSGHFPGSPIFPAVGIVDATLQALRAQFKNPSLSLSGLPVAKFISPIVPEQKIVLELRSVDKSKGDWQAEWKEQDSLKLLASLRVHCRG